MFEDKEFEELIKKREARSVERTKRQTSGTPSSPVVEGSGTCTQTYTQPAAYTCGDNARALPILGRRQLCRCYTRHGDAVSHVARVSPHGLFNVVSTY